MRLRCLATVAGVDPTHLPVMLFTDAQANRSYSCWEECHLRLCGLATATAVDRARHHCRCVHLHAAVTISPQRSLASDNGLASLVPPSRMIDCCIIKGNKGKILDDSAVDSAVTAASEPMPTNMCQGINHVHTWLNPMVFDPALAPSFPASAQTQALESIFNDWLTFGAACR